MGHSYRQDQKDNLLSDSNGPDIVHASSPAANIADIAACGSLTGADTVDKTVLENYLSDVQLKINQITAALIASGQILP